MHPEMFQIDLRDSKSLIYRSKKGNLYESDLGSPESIKSQFDFSDKN